MGMATEPPAALVRLESHCCNAAACTGPAPRYASGEVDGEGNGPKYCNGRGKGVSMRTRGPRTEQISRIPISPYVLLPLLRRLVVASTP